MAPRYANQASFTIAAKSAAHAGGALFPHQVIAVRNWSGKNVTDNSRHSDIRFIMELQGAAAAELRNLRRALRKPVIRARMANILSRGDSCLAMHEALPYLATEHKNGYRPVVDGEYSCPVCYVRHGEHFALRESIMSDGTVDAPMRKVIMQCDGCGYSTEARTSAANAAPWPHA
jgi:hypothetical protein